MLFKESSSNKTVKLNCPTARLGPRRVNVSLMKKEQKINEQLETKSGGILKQLPNRGRTTAHLLHQNGRTVHQQHRN